MSTEDRVRNRPIWTPVDCGCQTRVHADRSGIELNYCPTHAKAPEMVSLLRRLTGNPHEELNVSRVVSDARALLRQIEGES